MHPGYIQLAVAIVAEVVATSALKASSEFTRLVPSLLVVGGYALAFYMLSSVVKIIPIGVAYAVWAGAGVVLVALAGAVVYRQVPDFAAIAGMTLIVAGVVIIHVFSDTVRH